MVHPLGIYVALCNKAAHMIHNDIHRNLAEQHIIAHIQVLITIFQLANMSGKPISTWLSNSVFYQEALKKALPMP